MVAVTMETFRGIAKDAGIHVDALVFSAPAATNVIAAAGAGCLHARKMMSAENGFEFFSGRHGVCLSLSGVAVGSRAKRARRREGLAWKGRAANAA